MSKLPRSLKDVTFRSVALTAVSVAVLIAAACEGRSVTGPDEGEKILPPDSPLNLAAFICKATPKELTVSCAPAPDPMSPLPTYSLGIEYGNAVPSSILIGGQGVNVLLTSSNITNDNVTHHFAFDVTVKNLRPQPIGTTDGATTDSSLSVFFHSGPTTTGGTGITSVFNPTGIGAFTGAGQPFFKYGERLVQNQTSAAKNWILQYDATVTTFSFLLLVNANVQHPNGYIDVFASGSSVGVGSTLQIQDSVRDALGVATADQSETWSLSDSSKASINSSGLLTGNAPGSVTVTATQGSKTGSMVVTVTGAAPDARDDAFTTNTGSSVNGNLTVDNGSGADVLGSPSATVTSFGGGSLGGTVTTNAAGASVAMGGGTLTVNSDGTFSLTTPTTAGTYTFQYRLTNAVSTDDATVTITVRRLPDAKDDAFTTTTATTLNGNLTSDNGSGADDLGDPAATVTGFGGGSLAGNTTTNAAGASVSLGGGTLTVNSNGTVSLANPTTGGTYTFRYRLTNTVGVDSATVTINVNAAPSAVNDAPAGNSVPGNNWHTAFNTALNTPSVTANDNLGFPAATVASFGGGTLGGTVTTNAAGSTATFDGHSLTLNANGSFTYTPKTGFTGLFTTTYRITNAGGSSDATLTIAVGVRPAVSNTTYAPTLPGNVGINTSTSTLTKVGATGDALTYNLVSSPSGTANIHADGTFDFKPNVGFTGAATITFNVTNGFTTTSNATVSLTVGSPRIWFVADSASGTGDGRYGSPLKCLVGTTNCLSAVSLASGDVIHIAPGTYADNASFVPPANGRVIGQGASGNFADAANANVTWPADAGPQPGTAGARPVINSSAANAITLSNGNVIRGLIAGNATAVSILGNTFTSLTMGSAAIINANGRAIDLQTAGTLAVALDSIVATGGAGNGINLASQSGTFTSGITKITNPTVTGINVTNSAGFSFGTTVVRKTSTAGVGVNLISNSGTTAFSSLVDSTSNGDALVTSSAGTVSIGGGNIQAVNGAAVNATSTAFSGAGFSNIVTSGASATGVNLNGTSGTLALGGGSIDGKTDGFRILGGSTGTVTYSGTIGTSTRPVNISNAGAAACPTTTLSGSISAASSGILVQNCTSGTIAFSGTKTLKTTTNKGVQLATNTGATINFTNGALVDSTTSGNAFEATGGGTVEVSGAGNILRSTTGTALTVTSTLIAANGVTFQSISAAGGANGIVLSSTGASGSLKVTGNGGTCTLATPTCSGGIISNTTGADNSGTTPTGTGIVLNSTLNPSLVRMWIHDNTNYGIRGTSVSGFTLDTSVVSGVNGTNSSSPFNDASVRFDNLTGSASVKASNISGGFADNFAVINTSGSLDRITFANTTIGLNGVSGNDAVLIESSATAGALKATIQNSTFTGAAGDLINYIHNGTGLGDLVITNNAFSNNHSAIATGGGGLTLNNDGLSGATTMTITNNTFRDAVGAGLLIFKTTGASTQTGTFSGNTIGVSGIANSGSKEGSALKLQTVGQGTMTWSVTNNQIHGYNNNGIEVEAGGGATAQSGTINATITGNTVNEPGNTAGTIAIPKNGVHLNIGTVPGDTYQACVKLSSNNLGASGKDGNPATVGDIDVRLRQRQSTTIRLPGYAGANNDNTAVQNFVIAQNPATVLTALAANTVPTGGGYTGTGTTCP